MTGVRANAARSKASALLAQNRARPYRPRGKILPLPLTQSFFQLLELRWLYRNTHTARLWARSVDFRAAEWVTLRSVGLSAARIIMKRIIRQGHNRCLFEAVLAEDFLERRCCDDRSAAESKHAVKGFGGLSCQ